MEHVLDDAAEGALDFLIARAAVMQHLPDPRSEIIDAALGLAELILDGDETFQLGGFGLHEGKGGPVLVELALEVFELLQAIGAAEDLQDVPSAAA